ncbi:M12 family metallo-peptidase [Kaistella yonginensis]|uniref:M12 family metallo-peptidase n=1 Tax=Kaistella yonginensis TaxID=658267 RepID=UPI0025B4254A|nr:M12 family metallo-peptidase [Kaistella yonginensis]MDN3605307.1 M12 family metallo-peptidase [Kaistella yonginensis]
MKTKLSFLALFCVLMAFAQNRIFQQTISENQLAENQKVSKLLSDTYISTKYYQQSSFNLASALEFALPDGKVIKAKFKREFLYSNRSKSFVYDIQNESHAELVLSAVDDIVTGMYVSSEGEKIIFHQTDKSVFALSVVSESALINKDTRPIVDLDETLLSQKANPNVCLATTPACASVTVDVMVVFTPQAKTAWGGVSQSKSFITTAITNFNTSLINSGVSNLTINLVYAEEIAYVESGNISTDLSRFRTANDTYMDDVASLRSAYGADLCALITSTPTNTCGLGNLNTNPTNYSASAAYSVGIFSCVVSNYTLAHEMGHNMGLNHDWYVNQSTAPCDHTHGYTNKTAITLGNTSVSSQRWRTIMAYNDECSSKGFSCTRINRWANPMVNYNTEPTGIAIGDTKPADEASAYARFACVVSEFMPTSTLATTENNRIQIEDFTLYPIPAKEELNIRLKKEGSYSFRITNLAGQQVLISEQRNIKLKGLSPGQYFLSIYTHDNTLIGTKKFLVK